MLQTSPISAALSDPVASRRILDRLDCEASLLDFMRQGWAQVEPGTPLVCSWALEAVCEHLEAVTRGDIRRLLINIPPGFTKSMTSNVFWPSWEWGPRDQGHLRYISAAHEKELSIRDNVRARDLMTSEWYQANWGERWQFKGDQNAKIRYENTRAGWRYASSTGSGLTGHRGDRIILDDPHAVKDMESEAVREDALRWFSETLPTRLNRQAESAIVVIMQRVHERDVSGLILKQELGYEHLCLPMEFERATRCFTSVPQSWPAEKVHRVRREGEPLPRYLSPEEFRAETLEKPLTPEDQATGPLLLTCQDRRTEEGELLEPERFPEEAVDELKATFRSWGGAYAEAGQLAQRPAPRGGGMFQRSDFQYLDEAPDRVQWVRGWDLAATKDGHAAWTAGVKMGLKDGRVIIADVRKLRGSPGEVETALLDTATSDGKGVTVDLPQDPGQAGKAQKRSLIALLAGFNVTASPESGSKEDRARPLAAQAEGGNLWLVRGSWNDSFVNEACMFPNGEFKDQIDAASRAYARCIARRGQRRPMAPRIVGL